MALKSHFDWIVPLQVLVDKFQHVRFEPSGWTGNSEIPYAKSIMDYIFRWLGAKFISQDYRVSEAGDSPELKQTEQEPQKELPFQAAMDAQVCSECGSLMTSNGSCYKCEICGSTSGCS